MGERRIPQLCTWNVAVARCYVTERTAIARMGGARTGHMNSLVSTEMDYCAACGSLSNKSMTDRACKDVQLMLLVCVSVLLLNARKTETYRTP